MLNTEEEEEEESQEEESDSELFTSLTHGVFSAIQLPPSGWSYQQATPPSWLLSSYLVSPPTLYANRKTSVFYSHHVDLFIGISSKCPI